MASHIFLFVCGNSAIVEVYIVEIYLFKLSHELASKYASSAMKTLKSTAECHDLSAKNYTEIESLVNTILTRNS